MSMRYFIELSYRGTRYYGWQLQRNAPSVQQALEEGLAVLLREAVEVTGAGRTDTGVHAAYYVAHFDVAREIADPEGFCYHLNAVLPGDIAVFGLTRVADDAHARFDAVRREYRYHILSCKDPFRRETTWQYYVDMDIDAMNRAAALVLEHEDFTTFSKLHSNNKTTICHVYKSLWYKKNNELIYTVASDRFLRNMVRSLVGTLVDVGRGKLSVDGFADALRSLDRSRASGSAPAQGLFLSDVAYDENVFRSALPRKASGR